MVIDQINALVATSTHKQRAMPLLVLPEEHKHETSMKLAWGSGALCRGGRKERGSRSLERKEYH
jgi:hypothetical protein